MSNVTTQRRPAGASTDGIQFTDDQNFTLDNASLSFVYNPAKDVTSIEVVKDSTDTPVRVVFIGKDKNGVDVNIGEVTIGTDELSVREEFAEVIKRNSIDQSQAVDRIEGYARKGDDSADAVAGDLPAPVLVKIKVNNK